MNALIKKEIRLLLPGFVIGVALTFTNLLLQDDKFGVNAVIAIVSICSCAGLAVFIALNSFGAEISAGTFSMLLAQPISREVIWRTKTRVLAAALFLGGFLWSAILFLRLVVFQRPDGMGDFWEIFLGSWTFLAVVFSGALWTVLLLRQMAAAFWFTLLTPGVIMVLITGLWPEKYYDHYDACEVAVAVALLIYSGAGIWFARRLFLQAQDVAWTGGNIVWPEMRRTAGASSGAVEKHFWRPRAALFWKEVQLHQSQFVLAGALALLHLGVLATRKIGHFKPNSSTQFILEIFWGLWLVMPMLVGAAAVAEERKLGTLAGPLCLPVKWRTQFAVKFRMVLVLSVLFGAGMPLLLEGTRVLPGIHFLSSSLSQEAWLAAMNTRQEFFWFCLGSLNFLTPLLLLLGMATAIGAISFYASTLARNTLQALAPAVLGIIIFTFLLFNAAWPEYYFHNSFWHGSLIYFIGIPVCVVALVSVSYWNFQRLNLGANVWRRNGFVALASLMFVIGSTTTIYHRAWEKLTPFEPAHGAARLTRSNPPVLSEWGNIFSARRAGGKIWTDDYRMNFSVMNPLALFLGNIRVASQGDGHFLAGSNWVNVAYGIRQEMAGIKTDGTLWVSKPARGELVAGRWEMSKASEPVRFGNQTNWSSIVRAGMNMLLVKNDGTLWSWGSRTNWNWKNEWLGLQAFTPHRLGTESDWAEVFFSINKLCIRKTDGSVWTTSTEQPSIQPVREVEPGFSIQRVPYLESGKWRSTTTIWSGLSYGLAIGDDGTFRIRADERVEHRSSKSYGNYEWTAANLQFGNSTNWMAVAGHRDKVVTLKDDGTLWLWNFYRDNSRGWWPERNESEMLDRIPVRLGTHADWLAITSAEGGIISLAADGSLWYWPLENPGDFASYVRQFWDSRSQTYFYPLLDISRKPQLLGNVFGKAD